VYIWLHCNVIIQIPKYTLYDKHAGHTAQPTCKLSLPPFLRTQMHYLPGYTLQESVAPLVWSYWLRQLQWQIHILAPWWQMCLHPIYTTNRYSYIKYRRTLASFPGPAQLSVACSTILKATESWAGPGNEARRTLQNKTDGTLCLKQAIKKIECFT